jgi:Ca2+-dependent lipid-binding protein
MQAVGLRAADKKTSDPYAIVYWNDREVGQTKVVEKTLDPIWESDFELAIDPQIGEGTLRVEVFDHDVGSKSDFLGQIEIPLGGDDYGGQGVVMHRRAFPLQPDPRKPTERIPGAIVLRVEDPLGEMTPELQEYDGIARPATPHGLLEVTLVEARDLKKMDLLGKNDPYVVITVEGRTMRSTTIDGGGAKPSWCVDGGGGEVLEFEVEQAVSVELAVYDEDQDADDLIGTAIVELDHAPEDQDWALEDWFEIEDKKGKMTGAVHLQISWAQQRDREAMHRSMQRTQELQQGLVRDQS